MDNPGVYDLGSRSIGAALTEEVITSVADGQGTTREYVSDLLGMATATIHALFTYGSGGTTCVVTVETSLDQGSTWIEIARFAFTTANAQRAINLTKAPVTTVYTPAALSDNTVKDGLLGDRMRARVTSTGTYVSTTLALRLTTQ